MYQKLQAKAANPPKGKEQYWKTVKKRKEKQSSIHLDFCETALCSLIYEILFL